MTPDPLPRQARIDLERLVRRWRSLPLDRALVVVPAVYALAQAYADESADAAGIPRRTLPDLGAAGALDVLTVCSHDLARDGTPERLERLVAELADLRRSVGAA
ncbi:hypothetical protein [Agilicoccus flavus]|uniref:hypothetical protein n=1 Tax=Agilicoccus flavus TaxID=2775968 RepID=UPI001CF70621|nr:hypothetical protein [Agilicoccus flavus]